jgi:diketogulonate reductase-like aldo/keto reductase
MMARPNLNKWVTGGFGGEPFGPPQFSHVYAGSMPAENAEKHVVELSNGVDIPVFGFGCAFGDWTSSDAQKGVFSPEEAWVAIPKALRAGVRHFDCAYVYRTHRQVGTSIGLAMRDGLIQRKDVFLTTKVLHPSHSALFGKTCDIFAADFDVEKTLTQHILESIDELGVGHLDLLLLHWPGAFGSKDREANRVLRLKAWRVLEIAYEAGMTRAIGVSNWSEEHIADLITDGAKVVPQVNQIEVSPHCQYTKIMEYCRENKICIEAYSPLGSTAGGVLKDGTIIQLAQKYHKNPGQVVLKWLLQLGYVVLPRSSSEARMASNMDVFDFEISPDDMEAISALNKEKSDTNASPYDIA